MMRRMRPDDLPWSLRLTQAENWSHRLEDWEFHSRLGRGWVACTDEGEPVGTASWWAYGPSFGTIGLVLVDRQHQGKGIGRQLMNKVIDDAGARALELVATKAGLRLYRDCGFGEVGGIEQRQGVPASRPHVRPSHHARLRAAAKEDLPALVELDAAALGAPRPAVIESVLAAGSGVVAEHNGLATGFALMRASGRGATIGPLVAGDEALAIALVGHLLERQDGFMRIDIPADARRLGEWLDAAGLVRVDEVTTMVRGARPAPRAGMRRYGLVSQAIG
jgi:GNAT superfamily N-acetyltransferase